jgi:hypothetical protein
MSPEALSEASKGISLFASAREPIVIAFGFLISGSREQERKRKNEMAMAITNLNCIQGESNSFTGRLTLQCCHFLFNAFSSGRPTFFGLPFMRAHQASGIRCTGALSRQRE